MEFSSVIEVSLANLFNTPFGIALNVAFVWVLSLFIYLSSWFLFWCNWNSNFLQLSQNNYRSMNGNTLSVTIEVVLVSFLDRSQYMEGHSYSQPGYIKIVFSLLITLWIDVENNAIRQHQSRHFCFSFYWRQVLFCSQYKTSHPDFYINIPLSVN